MEVGQHCHRKMSWNHQNIKALLALCVEFNKHVGVLCYILPSVSSRVTEFLATKYTNDTRTRNLFMMIKEMVQLSTYLKMTNQTGLDICTPAFFPECLKEIMLEYLCRGLRDCEIMLSKFVHGSAAS